LFSRLIFKRFDLFSQIQRILTNPDESLVHRRTLNKPESLWILGFGFVNPYWFQKICFVDLFCILFWKIHFVDSFCGFVLWICFWKICLWIRFVKTKIPNYSIRFVLEGFVYKSCILKNLKSIFIFILCMNVFLIWRKINNSTFFSNKRNQIFCFLILLCSTKLLYGTVVVI
jgi:hypothetical protein